MPVPRQETWACNDNTNELPLQINKYNSCAAGKDNALAYQSDSDPKH